MQPQQPLAQDSPMGPIYPQHPPYEEQSTIDIQYLGTNTYRKMLDELEDIEVK